jgi:hypothetical protein
MQAAKYTTPALISVLRDAQNSPYTSMLVVAILAHTIPPVFLEAKPNFAQRSDIDIEEVFRTLLLVFKHPECSSHTLAHGTQILFCCAAKGHSHYDQAAVRFLVGCLRANDLEMRSNAMLSILSFHTHHSVEEVKSLDLLKMMNTVMKLPGHLQDLMMSYGVDRCDSHTILRAANMCQEAQTEAVQTRDFYSLGLKLVDLVTLHEYAILNGSWEVMEHGYRAQNDLGLPYVMWVDSLPVCAKELRQRNYQKHADGADMLDIKWNINKRDYAKIKEITEVAMARSPDIAFWYYARAVACTENDIVRWAKLGLKRKRTTPYIRQGLLEIAADNAARIGFERLEQAHPGSEEYVQALAYLHSASEDSMDFIAEAPPDSRGLRNVLMIAIMISVVIRGKELSPDLREIEVRPLVIRNRLLNSAVGTH